MASAYGKVILCGEHAVVHGGDALVASLDHGASATAELACEWRLAVCGQSVCDCDINMQALRKVASVLRCGPVEVSLDVAMPLGVGLGGSAAMGVAVARAIAELRNEPISNALVLAAAQAWEREFHGNPSGVDAAAAAFGGCLLYNQRQLTRAGEAGFRPKHVVVRESLHLALAVVGPPSLTRAMVERVEQCKRAHRLAFDATLDEIQSIVETATACVESGDLNQLGLLLSRNHVLLSRWGLSTPSIDHACALACASGAQGSKLTGAGGGGCVLALCSEHRISDVLHAWKSAGFRTFTTTVDCSSAV